MRVFSSVHQLTALAGADIGISDWLQITQERIQSFADVTGDQQWIHTDPERARHESPWGCTVAHGYLTVAMIPVLNQTIMRISGLSATVNYGLDKLRFPSAVPSGTRIRSRLTLREIKEQSPGRYLARYTTTVEIEGSEHPACVAENLALYIQAG